MKSHDFFAIGLMSGTSLDGLDLAYVKFTEEESKPLQFEFLVTESLAYPPIWEKKLRTAHLLSSTDLLKLHSEYGIWLGKKIKAFKKNHQIQRIDIIGSHGHTIFHQPEHGFTFQLGSGAAICEISGEDVVSDFRSQDIALGGQGAPLVPIGDELLFSDFDACLNLGGFANISFKKDDYRHAFDICPVNFVLNHLASKLHLSYDDRGKIAEKHKWNTDLFEKLNFHPFFEKTGPKSLGREWVEKEVFSLLEQESLSTPELIATYTHHIAHQLAKTLIHNNLKKILVTGGGAYNDFLIKKTQEISGAELNIPSSQYVEFKEALIFALLAVLRVQNKINVFSKVTGARQDSCSGSIFSVAKP